jgi:hypothetical protein
MSCFSTRRLICVAAPAALFTAASMPVQAQSCPAVGAAELGRVRCLVQHALDQARRASELASSLPGADPATVQLPARLVTRLELALDNRSTTADSIDELLRQHAAHGGSPAALLGGLQVLIDRLQDASQIGALAIVRHGTGQQVTAWDWTTQALEAAQRLWRPLSVCYIALRGGPPVTTVPAPCP